LNHFLRLHGLWSFVKKNIHHDESHSAFSKLKDEQNLKIDLNPVYEYIFSSEKIFFCYFNKNLVNYLIVRKDLIISVFFNF